MRSSRLVLRQKVLIDRTNRSLSMEMATVNASFLA